MYTAFTNTSLPTMPGLYLTQRRMTRNRRNLVTFCYWTGERWVLTGNVNKPGETYAPGPNGRVNQQRYWCGLKFNPTLMGGAYPAGSQAAKLAAEDAAARA